MDQGIGYAASSDGLAENSKKLEKEKNWTDYTESLLQEMDQLLARELEEEYVFLHSDVVGRLEKSRN
ncbi:MAG: hypothetical protein NO515_04740 [Candidatus Methanomethylicia archaeon]|jgi:hypothetical protein|nr:hypothetical protein [Candidatus Methanomethylicia archaeon]